MMRDMKWPRMNAEDDVLMEKRRLQPQLFQRKILCESLSSSIFASHDADGIHMVA